MRILHVIDPAFPGGGATTLRQLAAPLRRIRSVEQRVVLLGHRGHARLARRCGVRPHGTVPVPAGRPLLAARALRRVIDAWEAEEGAFDVLQGWTLGSAVALGAAAAGRRILAWSATGPVSEPGLAAVRRAARRNPVPMLTADPAARDGFVDAGFAPEHLSVLPPGVDPDELDPGDRTALRTRGAGGRDGSGSLSIAPLGPVTCALSFDVAWSSRRSTGLSPCSRPLRSRHPTTRACRARPRDVASSHDVLLHDHGFDRHRRIGDRGVGRAGARGDVGRPAFAGCSFDTRRSVQELGVAEVE